MPHRRASSKGASTSRLLSSSTDSDMTLLSIGQHVTALGAGPLEPGSGKDILVVGSQTHLLAYDVENNCDLFYKEVRPPKIGRAHV